jgi:hypothetical protein
VGSSSLGSRPFIRAGILGGIALIVLDLLGLIPLVGVCALLLGVVVYAAAGAAAAHWLPPPRTAGPAAGQGALAGLIAALIGTLAQVALIPLSITMAGGSQNLANMLPPESLSQLQQVGIDPQALFSSGTYAGITLVCCLPAALVIGAGLGALGAAIYAAVRSDTGTTTLG